MYLCCVHTLVHCIWVSVSHALCVLDCWLLPRNMKIGWHKKSFVSGIQQRKRKRNRQRIESLNDRDSLCAMQCAHVYVVYCINYSLHEIFNKWFWLFRKGRRIFHILPRDRIRFIIATVKNWNGERWKVKGQIKCMMISQRWIYETKRR